MATYIYDIEIIPNAFAILFVNINQKDIIDKFIDADIKGDIFKRNEILKTLKKEIFVIYDNVNDLHRLYKFLSNKDRVKTKYFIGYNNSGYDDIIVDFIIQNYKRLSTMSIPELLDTLYRLSKAIIDSNLPFFEIRKANEINYSNKYMSVDLQRLNNLHKLGNRVSLKQLSIYIKWYKIEDYDMPPYTKEQYLDLYPADTDLVNLESINARKAFDRKIHKDEFENLILYLYNDVFISDKVFMNSLDEFASRVNIYKKYGILTFSSPRAGVAEKVMRLLYSQYTGLKYADFINQRTWRKVIYFRDIIHSNIKFKTEELSNILERIKTIRFDLYGKKPFRFDVLFKGVGYTMALGGLHSKDRGGAFTSTENYYIMDADVDSYYPRSIVQYKIRPEHLSVIIIEIIHNALKERLYYKRNKDKANAYIYKIIINSIFGKYGDADSIFKDDKAMYTVTINNQLLLLMLIEDLELVGINVISANTDGVTAKVPKAKLQDYQKVLDDWCIRTGFTLEVNKYLKYIRTSVNDYVALIDKDGKREIKGKGDFDKDKYKDFSSGYYYPVVPKAIEKYYLEGIPIKDTIFNETDILDFCMSQKTGNDFRNELHVYVKGKHKIIPLTKTLRFYASLSGGTLIKTNVGTGKQINILKGQKVELLNRLRPVSNIENYNVNYIFYIEKCNDIINKVNNAITSVMKKTSGTLFDNLEDL